MHVLSCYLTMPFLHVYLPNTYVRIYIQSIIGCFRHGIRVGLMRLSTLVLYVYTLRSLNEYKSTVLQSNEDCIRYKSSF
jgi:hypothetical protein